MHFTEEDKVVIKNEFEEFGWSAYKIWQTHKSKNWAYSSVKRLLQKYKKTGSMNRKPGSGRPRTVTTEENMDLVENLICSQEEPHTHLAPRKISDQTGISRSSVRRMVRRRNLRQFKRLKTPRMSEATRDRRETRVVTLKDRYESNKRMIEKTVWQDEKDFTLEVPVNLQNDRVYGKGRKADVPDANLFSSTNRMSKKVMVSAAISWYGVTKPFFVNSNGIKVNKENYRLHLKKELFPTIERLVKRDDWIFAQDGAPSHRSALVQDFLSSYLKRRFIRAEEWPPSSPDLNPLDYFFWDFVKTRVYEGRYGRPFASEDELKERIKSVWKDSATDLTTIRKAIKQFVPRLKYVEEKHGRCIKMMFG